MREETNRYKKSNAMLKRAEKVIPLGSQTFSKSRIQFPEARSPLFLDRGRGGRVWDIDENEYVDLICALLPVILGYQDPDVDKAIKEQLENGISFSLATTLEIELAERMAEIIPCAEMVRFGKNGSDATSAAVRIARAVTGRDRIAACGYHGWQDWYIGATVRNKGIPKSVSELTHKFPYNEINALHTLFRQYPGEFAAVILEPMNVIEPYPGYLQEIRQLAHKNRALLIMDEIITGFRFALGGAQELFGVTPDLATFGKSMGNGMPISAVVGKADYMREMEEIFFSSTFGGETLSLAASIAVIDKMRRESVIETIWKNGDRISTYVSQKIGENGLDEVVAITGRPCWKHLQFKDHSSADKDTIKTFFIREMLKSNILINSSHNICYAHSAEDLELAKKAYDRTLRTIAVELENKTLAENLGCSVVRPIFSVR